MKYGVGRERVGDEARTGTERRRWRARDCAGGSDVDGVLVGSERDVGESGLI